MLSQALSFRRPAGQASNLEWVLHGTSALQKGWRSAASSSFHLPDYPRRQSGLMHLAHRGSINSFEMWCLAQTCGNTSIARAHKDLWSSDCLRRGPYCFNLCTADSPRLTYAETPSPRSEKEKKLNLPAWYPTGYLHLPWHRRICAQNGGCIRLLDSGPHLTHERPCVFVENSIFGIAQLLMWLLELFFWAHRIL